MGAENLKPRKKGDPALPGGGRPKGSLNTKTILAKMLSLKKTFEVDVNGKKKKMKMTSMERMLYMQVLNAEKGELPSFNAIVDRFEGKPGQEINHSVEGSIAFIYAEAPGNDPINDE